MRGKIAHIELCIQNEDDNTDRERKKVENIMNVAALCCLFSTGRLAIEKGIQMIGEKP
jgi:hypothetical protein